MKIEEIIGSALALIMVIPLLAIGCMLEAWAIVTMWGWFVTTQWGIQPPTYAVAVGLSLISGLITQTGTEAHEKYESKMSFLWILLLRAPLIVACGWVAKHWVIK